MGALDFFFLIFEMVQVVRADILTWTHAKIFFLNSSFSFFSLLSLFFLQVGGERPRSNQGLVERLPCSVG